LITGKANSAGSSSWHRLLPWLNIGLTIILIVAGLWFLSTRVSLREIGAALYNATSVFVLAGVAIVLLTLVLKAWRWKLMFTDNRHPITFVPAFWGTALGQYVNLVIPFLRLGEVARLYALNRETGANPVQAAGTLVVEKTLDLIFLGLTVLLILPFVILPEYVSRPVLLLALPIFIILILFLLAYQTKFIIQLWRMIIRPLPQGLQGWFLRVAVTGLEGLAALRSPRLSFLLLVSSLLIALLSVLLPFILFPALNLSLSLLDAALIHVVVTIAIAPPSTPAKIGVFNGAAALMLYQFGLTDETVIYSYAILFYLVAITPQIILGIIASARSRWRWQPNNTELPVQE
jgi:glycosyltransferase 2 family protein